MEVLCYEMTASWRISGGKEWKINKDLLYSMWFPGGSDGKESACNVGGLGSIPGLGRASGGGRGNPLQCSGLENPRWQRSLAGCSPRGHRQSDVSERPSAAQGQSPGNAAQLRCGQSPRRVRLCRPRDRSAPGFPGLHYPGSLQTHVCWVSNATQPSRPLSSPSPPARNLSQHHHLFSLSDQSAGGGQYAVVACVWENNLRRVGVCMCV